MSRMRPGAGGVVGAVALTALLLGNAQGATHEYCLGGILPPRSYFRFAEAAVDSERHQREALGFTLSPS